MAGQPEKTNNAMINHSEITGYIPLVRTFIIRRLQYLISLNVSEQNTTEIVISESYISYRNCNSNDDKFLLYKIAFTITHLA